MVRTITQALAMLAVLTVLTGIVYPLAVTGVARLAFAAQAEGSLIEVDGRLVGSRLIGQPFSDPGYFWGRPSATAPLPYNAGASGGSNQGSLNPVLHEAVTVRIAALRAADAGNAQPVPVDLVTASGSGLDPHISPAAARYQIVRVARGVVLRSVQSLEIVKRRLNFRSIFHRVPYRIEDILEFAPNKGEWVGVPDGLAVPGQGYVHTVAHQARDESVVSQLRLPSLQSTFHFTL